MFLSIAYTPLVDGTLFTGVLSDVKTTGASFLLVVVAIAGIGLIIRAILPR